MHVGVGGGYPPQYQAQPPLPPTGMYPNSGKDAVIIKKTACKLDKESSKL
jgi:hypothetical protein